MASPGPPSVMLGDMDYTTTDLGSITLVTIGVQNRLVNGMASVPSTTEVFPELSRLLNAFRNADKPIVHVIRLYEPGCSDADPIRRDAIERGAQIVAPSTHGAQILAAITG